MSYTSYNCLFIYLFLPLKCHTISAQELTTTFSLLPIFPFKSFFHQITVGIFSSITIPSTTFSSRAAFQLERISHSLTSNLFQSYAAANIISEPSNSFSSLFFVSIQYTKFVISNSFFFSDHQLKLMHYDSSTHPERMKRYKGNISA